MDGMDWFIQVEDIAQWLRSLGLWAVAASLLLSVIVAILGVVPSLFLSGANAVVFGIVPGFWISLTGEALGAAVSFWLYRWGFGKLKQVKQESWAWLRKLNEANRGRRIVILLIARLTPLMPSGVITFAAAASHMAFLDFIVITFIGKAPSIALETLVGHDLALLNENYPRLIVSLLLLAVIFLLMKKKSSNRRSE
jgi:uncharacterized membrane protein YdjX (TVP38/TMEM64 family)